MILEMKCAVESATDLPMEYKFTFDQKEVTFTPSLDANRRSVVAEISIKKRIPESAGFRAVSRPPSPDGMGAEIRIEGTGELVEELKEDLQFLESLLSLCMVTKFKWESATQRFIPETIEEQRSLGVYEIQYMPTYAKAYRPLKVEWLNQEVNRFRELTIPLAFFREGIRSYYQFNNIASFQNFYFIIEGFYAEGEYKNQDKFFTRNRELLAYAHAAFPQILQMKDKLEPFFNFYKLDMTPESFLKLSVKIRHRIHHYFNSIEDKGYFGNPFEQDFYQPIALSLMLLCIHILLGKVQALLTGPRGKP